MKKSEGKNAQKYQLIYKLISAATFIAVILISAYIGVNYTQPHNVTESPSPIVVTDPPSATIIQTSIPSSTVIPTVSTTVIPTIISTATPTVKPTATPTATSMATPTVKPTATPTVKPTTTPTVKPTATPTVKPTTTPTVKPTTTPTVKPTTTPTVKPTATPTVTPTTTPTVKPTATPTVTPITTPTAKPTATPTVKPTATPTVKPTATPTVKPTATPTVAPTTTPVIGNMNIELIPCGGDSAMISSGGEYMLIDTGADSNAALDYVERNGIERLEYLVITNFESCHTGGLWFLVSSDIEIGTVIIPDIPKNYISPSVKRAISSLEADCEVVRIGLGDADYRFDFGDGKFTLFAPLTLRAEDHVSSYSIITSIEVSGKRILFMSDATAENLTAMVENSTLPKADVITVASHGRYDVWNDDVLSEISPDIAIVTPITFIDTEIEVDAVTQKLELNGINVISVMDDVVELNVTDGELTIK